MIVSHEHKFIFLKNRKVAGSSMERSLAEVCGPDDIISKDPCQPPLARNFDAPIPVWREIFGTRNPIQMARSIRDWRTRPAFYTHLDAYSARERLGRKVWDSYFKFCFERNPWDKCVSFYWWFYRGHEKPELTFREHMMKRWLLLDRHIPSDWMRYTIRGSLAMDFVGDFSSMQEDFGKAMSEIGIDCSIGHSEKVHTRDETTRNLASEYDEELRERVAQLFHREIGCFGYRFPG